MKTNDLQIPVLILIDVEPDGFFVGHDDRRRWLGFEQAMKIVSEIRQSLAEQTCHSARFTWLVRADGQIAEVYDSPAWALEYYHDSFDELLAAQDEVGAHVHAYRWIPDSKRWIEDYGNQEWVEQCVRMAIGAVEATFGYKPRGFSIGMDWTNQATIRLVTDLQVRYEFSVVCRKESQSLWSTLGAYTGVAPDYSGIPQVPYHPSANNFALPAAPPGDDDDIWIFPQCSRIAPFELSWKRRALFRLQGKPRPGPCTRKFFLTDDPAGVCPAVNALLDQERPTYLTFAIRTDEFYKRRSLAAIRNNLANMLAHPAAKHLVFATPAEALEILQRNAGAIGTPRNA